jgi:hypothetical protein
MKDNKKSKGKKRKKDGEVSDEIKRTLFDKIEFAIALVVGLQISLLFETYVIPLIPIGGFWGMLLTIFVFLGILALFVVIKSLTTKRDK